MTPADGGDEVPRGLKPAPQRTQPALQVLALADDLTGALEIGAQLTSEGLPCVVSVDGRLEEAGTTVAVLNLETRHLGEADAERHVREAVFANPAPHIFLKTDSTLRGRIRESLRALRAALPDREIVYVPAYPALGRTVRDGILYVHGVPLAETDFARDPLNPVRDSSVRTLAGDLAVIHDGECEADLAAVAEGFDARPRVVAGTAAFARYWARTLKVEHAAEPSKIPRASVGMVVIGSRHPASRAQAARAGGLPGWTIHQLPPTMCGNPLDVAAACGAEVRGMLERSRVAALVVFGGDTAAAILKALACRRAYPCGELLPGVPVSRIEALGRNFVLVTKAGGFGDELTLVRIIEGIQ